MQIKPLRRRPRSHVFNLVVVTIAFFLLRSVNAWAVSEMRLVSAVEGLRHVAVQDPQENKLLFMLEKGLRAYSSLDNYRALFHKTEKGKNGALGETEKIFLKFEKPWKIFMGWRNTSKQGLQVVYERGRNDGKLAIHHPSPLTFLTPVIFLEQTSPLVREGSASYNIEDAGIGTFLNDFTRAVLRASRQNTLKVSFDAGTADVVFSDKPDTDYFTHRVRVGFDERTGLPILMELFDDSNQPTGIYEYKDLKVNLSKDQDFENQIHSGLLKVYSHSR